MTVMTLIVVMYVSEDGDDRDEGDGSDYGDEDDNGDGGVDGDSGDTVQDVGARDGNEDGDGGNDGDTDGDGDDGVLAAPALCLAIGLLLEDGQHEDVLVDVEADEVLVELAQEVLVVPAPKMTLEDSVGLKPRHHPGGSKERDYSLLVGRLLGQGLSTHRIL